MGTYILEVAFTQIVMGAICNIGIEKEVFVSITVVLDLDVVAPGAIHFREVVPKAGSIAEASSIAVLSDFLVNWKPMKTIDY
jgi:hypothetical protein